MAEFLHTLASWSFREGEDAERFIPKWLSMNQNTAKATPLASGAWCCAGTKRCWCDEHWVDMLVPGPSLAALLKKARP